MTPGEQILYETAEKIYALEKQGKKILRLNIGEPDWRPPASAINQVSTALRKGHDKYASAAGEKELRERIAQIHQCRSENVVITPGSKWGIFMLLAQQAKPGENVIAFSPHWTGYESMCRGIGIRLQFIRLKEENNWKPDFEELTSAIDAGTRMIVLNSPANPTSHAWSEREEKELISIASEKRIPVLADDAYRDLCFDGRPDRPFTEEIRIAHTFSKTFGMTGWRLGYIIVPELLARQSIAFNQRSISNVPVFIQEAGNRLLIQKKKLAAKARKNCQARAGLAARMLGTKTEMVVPNAGFYAFPKIPASIPLPAFLDALLEKGIGVAPGPAFGNNPHHIRISLCRENKVLRPALEKITETVEEMTSSAT
ncbi:MAG: pyridoxal phosphate-dependent aminotransferase [Candidatus Diapherotrites archaeon]|nr:pyridoxal phosphate-dependent aminotransferase [Candidatus Diapherotrites archaeon]